MRDSESAEVLVKVEGLCKSFGGNRVLNKLSFQIEPGHIIGLVGPNSGGKSTLLRHLIGMYLPSEGHCHTFGVEAGKLSSEQLANIGYVHQEAELMGWMSCNEIINYSAAHYPTWNKELERHLVKVFELNLKQKVGLMSPGHRQKLSILLAVAFEPKLLILDEPASALDPIARRHFLELLLDILQDPNKTILISSHILHDIEKVIDQLLVLDAGRLLKNCPFDDLREDYVKLELISLSGDLPASLPFRHVFACELEGGHAMVTMKRSDLTLDEMRARLNSDIIQHPLSFEEIYPLILEETNASWASKRVS